MILSVFCFLGAFLIGPNDWPGWRGPDHNNVSTEAGWTTEGEAPVLWRASIGMGYSSPSVADGRLVIQGYIDSTEEPGTGVDRLSCFDATTGELQWSREYEAEIYNNEHEGGVLSTPTISEGVVYLASRAGGLRAYELATGEPIWEVDLVERHQVFPGRYGFASSPYLDGSKLILNAGVTLALDRETGETLWVSENYDANYSTVRPIQLGESAGYVVFGGKGLNVVDAEDGTLLREQVFRKGNRNVEGATPIVMGTKVFISSGYEQGGLMVDFAPDEPLTLWRTRRMRNKMAGSTLWRDHFYGFDESMLKCIDLEGNEKWRQRGLGHGAVSVANGHLILTTSRGDLVIAEATPEAFRETSRQSLIEEGSFWAAPVLANGLIYVRGSHGDLACVDRRKATGALASADRSAIAPADLPTPAELVAKHLAVSRLDQHEIPGLTMTGKLFVKSLGLAGVAGLWQVDAEGRMRERFDLPPGMQGSIEVLFNGELGWKIDPYRGDQLMKSHTLAELQSLGGPRTLLSPLPKSAMDSKVTYEPFYGTPCFRVDVPIGEEAARAIYFHAGTGRLHGRSAPKESSVLFGSWREVDGVVLPFHRTEFDPESGEERRWRFSEIELRAPEASIFEVPEKVLELLEEAEEEAEGEETDES